MKISASRPSNVTNDINMKIRKFLVLAEGLSIFPEFNLNFFKRKATPTMIENIEEKGTAISLFWKSP